MESREYSLQPYEGDEPFIFFSYCHADSDVVYPLLDALMQRGYRIWFDSGITIGDEWPEVIADKLEKCTVFLPAITRAYCRSHNCKNELTFQVEDKKPIYPLKIEDFPLIGGIRLQLAGTQYVTLSDIPAEKWPERVTALEPLAKCKGAPAPRREPKKKEPPLPEGDNGLLILPSLFGLGGQKQSRADAPAQEKPAPDAPAQVEPSAEVPCPDVPPAGEQLPEEHAPERPCPGKASGGTEMLTERTEAVEPTVEIEQTGTTCADDTISSEEECESFLLVRLPEGAFLRPADNRLRLPEIGLVLRAAARGDGIVLQNRGKAPIALPGRELAPGRQCTIRKSFVAELADSGYAMLQRADAAWLRSQGRLFLLTAEDTGERRLILKDGLTMGRDHPWALGSMRDMRISHEHAHIAIRDGQAILTDHSRNGTFVNSRRISSRDGGEQPLHEGDELRLGRERFRFCEIIPEDAQAKQRARYDAACAAMDCACTREDYLRAAEEFEALEAFGDSAGKRQLCLQRAQEAEKNWLLAQARALSELPDPESAEQAVPILRSLGAWQDAPRLLTELTRRLETQRAQEQRYREACRKLEAADSAQLLAEAERMFASLGSYRDSGSQQLRCRAKAEAQRRSEEQKKNAIYQQALLARSEGRAEEAAGLLATVPGWRDADALRDAFASRSDPDDETIRIRPAVREQLLVVNLSTGEAYPGRVQSTVIGRKVNQCDIPFPGNGMMSRRHAEVFSHEGKHYVRDCRSANGTVVDGKQLEPEQTVQIGDTAVLSLAGERLLVAFDTAAVQVTGRGYAALLERISDGVVLPVAGAALQFDYLDPEQTVLLGRTPDSRCATIFADRTGIVLRVLRSGCVSINGEPLEGGSEYPLSDDASLKLGDGSYRFRKIPLVLLNGRSDAE